MNLAKDTSGTPADQPIRPVHRHHFRSFRLILDRHRAIAQHAIDRGDITAALQEILVVLHLQEQIMSAQNSQLETLTSGITALQAASALEDAQIATAITTVGSLTASNATLQAQVTALQAAAAQGIDLTSAIAALVTTTADINTHATSLSTALTPPAAATPAATAPAIVAPDPTTVTTTSTGTTSPTTTT